MAKKTTDQLVAECRQLESQRGLAAALAFAQAHGLRNTAERLAVAIAAVEAHARKMHELALAQERRDARATAARVLGTHHACRLGGLSAAELNRRFSAFLATRVAA